MKTKLKNFFDGMTKEAQLRFMSFSKGFEYFAVEPKLCKVEENEITIVFIKDKNVVFLAEDNCYRISKTSRFNHKLINTISTNPLERDIYNVGDLPEVDIDSLKASLVSQKNLSFKDLKNIPSISESKELEKFFFAISHDLSFDELDGKGYSEDDNFLIETIFEIIGSHDGNGSSFVKRIIFKGETVLYANYKGKYGDEPEAHIVNKSAYNDLLNYIEKEYNPRDFVINEDNTLISDKFSSSFYDFVETFKVK